MQILLDFAMPSSSGPVKLKRWQIIDHLVRTLLLLDRWITNFSMVEYGCKQTTHLTPTNSVSLRALFFSYFPSGLFF